MKIDADLVDMSEQMIDEWNAGREDIELVHELAKAIELQNVLQKTRNDAIAKTRKEVSKEAETIARKWWKTRRANPEELFDSIRRLR